MRMCWRSGKTPWDSLRNWIRPVPCTISVSYTGEKQINLIFDMVVPIDYNDEKKEELKKQLAERPEEERCQIRVLDHRGVGLRGACG